MVVTEYKKYIEFSRQAYPSEYYVHVNTTLDSSI